MLLIFFMLRARFHVSPEHRAGMFNAWELKQFITCTVADVSLGANVENCQHTLSISRELIRDAHDARCSSNSFRVVIKHFHHIPVGARRGREKGKSNYFSTTAKICTIIPKGFDLCSASPRISLEPAKLCALASRVTWIIYAPKQDQNWLWAPQPKFQTFKLILIFSPRSIIDFHPADSTSLREHSFSAFNLGECLYRIKKRFHPKEREREQGNYAP